MLTHAAHVHAQAVTLLLPDLGTAPCLIPANAAPRAVRGQGWAHACAGAARTGPTRGRACALHLRARNIGKARARASVALGPGLPRECAPAQRAECPHQHGIPRAPRASTRSAPPLYTELAVGDARRPPLRSPAQGAANGAGSAAPGQRSQGAGGDPCRRRRAGQGEGTQAAQGLFTGFAGVSGRARELPSVPAAVVC